MLPVGENTDVAGGEATTLGGVEWSQDLLMRIMRNGVGVPGDEANVTYEKGVLSVKLLSISPMH